MIRANSASRRSTAAQSTLREMLRPPQTASASALVPVRILASAHVAQRIGELVARADVDVLLSAVGGGLTLRVRLQADESAAGPRFAYGRLTVDWARGRIAGDGGSIGVSRTELRLLGALLEGDGEPIAREDLVRSTWPEAVDRQSSSLLAVYVHTLRRRLSAVGLSGALETVRGVGYRLRV